jgi:hypothetical protein
MKPGKGDWDEGGYDVPVRNGNYKKELGEAKAALETNKGFRNWFHTVYKKKHVSRSGERHNPDMSDDAILKAFREWLEQ